MNIHGIRSFFLLGLGALLSLVLLGALLLTGVHASETRPPMIQIVAVLCR